MSIIGEKQVINKNITGVKHLTVGNINIKQELKLEGDKHALILNNVTTSNRANVDAENGGLIYNTSTHALNVYENGTWKEIGASGGGGSGEWIKSSSGNHIYADYAGVGIGDFSGSDPASQLHIDSSTGNCTTIIQCPDGAGEEARLRLKRGASNSYLFAHKDNDSLDIGYNGASSLNIDSVGAITLGGTTGALTIHKLTTVQRDALTASEGNVIYNTTTSKFQGYNGSWEDLNDWNNKSDDIYRNSKVGIGNFASDTIDTDLHITSQTGNDCILRVETLDAADTPKYSLLRNSNTWDMQQGSSGELQFAYNTTDLLELESGGDLYLASGKFVISGAKQFHLGNCTTAQRTALSASNGDLVYDTDLHAAYIYENSSWSAIAAGNDTSKWTEKSGDIYRNSSIGLGDFSADTIDSNIHIRASLPEIKFADTTYSSEGLINIASDGRGSPDSTMKISIGTTSGIHIFNEGRIAIGGFTSFNDNDISLDLVDTDKGFVLNRVSTTTRNAMNAVSGMLIFNSTTQKLNFYNGAAWEVVTSA